MTFQPITDLPVVYTEDQIARQLGVHPETIARERRGETRAAGRAVSRAGSPT